MNFERLFARTMTERVTLDRVVSLDAYGEPAYAAPLVTETYTAWIRRGPIEIRGATAEVRAQGAGRRGTTVYLGQRVETSGALTPLSAVTVPTPEDRLTLPDGSRPPIVEVRELRDPDGDVHVELVL